MAGSIREVREYYDKSQKWYRWLYSDRTSLGIHYGFSNGRKTTLRDSLIAQYSVVSELLDIQDGDRVLDAGCGVGGGAIWLAEHTDSDTSFIGITVSSVQARLAAQYARERGVAERMQFILMDYGCTAFPERTFHHVFGIESFCHSYPDLALLLSEMKRILRPGGRIVMSDGVFLREPNGNVEHALAQKMCKGYRLCGWITVQEVVSAFERVGFRNITFIDKTSFVRDTVRLIYRIGKVMAFPLLVLRAARLISKPEFENLYALYAQKHLYERGVFGYGTFCAEK